jgi:O-6-methylguanine DNA methyltransferase
MHDPLPPPLDLPVIAVGTTGIFCRAGCPAPSPKPENVTHLPSARAALFAGYRACLRCKPLSLPGLALTDATLRRAELLRPVLAAARRARRRRSGAATIVTTVIDTPLGPMLAGATDDGVCLAEFSDRPMLPTQLETLRRRLGRPIVAGLHPHLDRLKAELHEYFAGSRRAFDVPLVAPGSPFQERTWAELRGLTAGTTISYEELAARVGRPAAQRAVGTANGANRIAVVIPCHRVVRKSGETGNYGGGRWRKEWLLAHEQRLSTTPRRAGA